MSTNTNIPEDLRYTKDHEWITQKDGMVTVGMTDHAQHQLGDIVYLELPDKGSFLEMGTAFGVVESVKAVSDLFAPISGEVVEINEALVDAPEAINHDPYHEAWLLKIRPSKPEELGQLLTANAYKSYLAEEAK